jgi:hypothetical protein
MWLSSSAGANPSMPGTTEEAGEAARSAIPFLFENTRVNQCFLPNALHGIKYF